MHFLKFRGLVVSPGRARPARCPEVCPAGLRGRWTVVSCSSEEGGRLVRVPRGSGSGSRGAPSLWGRGVLPGGGVGGAAAGAEGTYRAFRPYLPPSVPHLSLNPLHPPPSPSTFPPFLPPSLPPSLSGFSSPLHPPCFLAGQRRRLPRRPRPLGPARAQLRARGFGSRSLSRTSKAKGEEALAT